jgi:hypothetical protein
MNNFIFEDKLSDSSICDDIIKYFHQENTKKFDGMIGNGVDKAIKDSIDSKFHLTDNSINWIRKYREELINIVKKYERKYLLLSNLGMWGSVEYSTIQYYKPNCGFTYFHCERTKLENSDRHLVFMTYLNNVKQGGQTEFYHQKVKIKPKKGKTLIWPADWTHTHRGIVAPKEEKFIVTGWLNFISKDSLIKNYE